MKFYDCAGTLISTPYFGATVNNFSICAFDGGGAVPSGANGFWFLVAGVS